MDSILAVLFSNDPMSALGHMPASHRYLRVTCINPHRGERAISQVHRVPYTYEGVEEEEVQPGQMTQHGDPPSYADRRGASARIITDRDANDRYLIC